MNGIFTVNGAKVIKVEGSGWTSYLDLLRYHTQFDSEEGFIRHLREAINANVPSFYVPVYGPSIDEKHQLQFIPGRYPAVEYDLLENMSLGEKRGFYLGSIEQYDLFLATLIYRLIVIEHWDINQAFHAVCEDSTPLGNYDKAENARCRIENTGSRIIAGLSDLANTRKMVDIREDSLVCLVGGCYSDRGFFKPLASRGVEINFRYQHVTGFFVADAQPQ